MAESHPLRILLVDDYATVRQALKLLLEREPDLEVVSEGDGAEAIEWVDQMMIDVIVINLSVPGTSGLVTTRRFKEVNRETAIVTLTRDVDRTNLQELLRAGTRGYVLNTSPHHELLRAVRTVAAGQHYVDPALTQHLAAPVTRQPHDRSLGTSSVTSRESQVLRLASLGHGNKDIAAQLGLSVKTIELHKATAMQKLGLQGRIELLRFALHNGWLHDA